MANNEMSVADKEFLARCEEILKDRYTEKDEDFMTVFNSVPSKPPVLESWWVPNNFGRRNDRRHNRRYHPWERNTRDDSDRRNYDRQDRGYNNYDRRDRGYNQYDRGNNDRRPQHRL